MKIYSMIISIKKNLITIFCIVFIIMIVVYSKSSIGAVKSGLELWINNVVPTLFPFFIATEILCHTNIINLLGKLLEKPVSKIFNVPGEGVFPLIMGMICGYPSGAKIVANLKKEKILNSEEAERLIAFTNNSGPLFVLGTVGVSLLKSSHIGYILLISHIISCILVGVIFRNWKKLSVKSYSRMRNIEEKNVQLKDFGGILSNSIRTSTATVVNIGGFVVWFSVIISILNSSGFFLVTGHFFEKLNIPSEIGNGIISGIIELTNGVKNMSLIPVTNINICIVSFLIGFGGISVLFQVYSIISKENIPIKPYLYGKLLQGIVSFAITGILLII